MIFVCSVFGALVTMARIGAASTMFCASRSPRGSRVDVDTWPVTAAVRALRINNVNMTELHVRTSAGCIHLANNRLHEWPRTLPCTVEHLNLSYNFINDWPTVRFPHLLSLDLSHNNLTTVNLTALLAMPLLHTINLAYNLQMDYLGPLTQHPTLKHVILSPDKWYAVSNIDAHLHVYLTDNEDAFEIDAGGVVGARRRAPHNYCDYDVDVYSCVERFVSMSANCMACYECNATADVAIVDVIVADDATLGYVRLLVLTNLVTLLALSVVLIVCRRRTTAICASTSKRDRRSLLDPYPLYFTTV